MNRLPPHVTDSRREAMAQAFAHVLGNTCCLQRVTLCYEWNVTGPASAEAAALFHRQAMEMFRAQGALAARIRVMGQVAVPDESEGVLPWPLRETCARAPHPRELVDLLAEGHETALVSIRAASDVAAALDDRASLMVLDLRLLAHERHVLQLSAFAR